MLKTLGCNKSFDVGDFRSLARLRANRCFGIPQTIRTEAGGNITHSAQVFVSAADFGPLRRNL